MLVVVVEEEEDDDEDDDDEQCDHILLVSVWCFGLLTLPAPPPPRFAWCMQAVQVEGRAAGAHGLALPGQRDGRRQQEAQVTPMAAHGESHCSLSCHRAPSGPGY